MNWREADSLVRDEVKPQLLLAVPICLLGEGDLVKAFNDAIAKIRADGTYAKINAKYFDFDVYGK